MARLPGSRPEPSTIATPGRAVPLRAATSRMTATPAAVEPPLPDRTPSSFVSSSAVWLSLNCSIWRTTSRSGADAVDATVVAPAGAVPEAGSPTTVTPRRRSRSVMMRAAFWAGSAARSFTTRGLPSLRTSSLREKPSSTESALRGPDWFWRTNRSGHVGTVRSWS